MDKSSRLYLRQACKKGETSVSFAALGVVGVQGPAGPQGPKGDTGTGVRHLFDSTGAQIGVVNGTIDLFWVSAIVPINGSEYSMAFTKDDLQGHGLNEQHDFVYWETSDCSGLPLVRALALENQLLPPFVRPAIVIGSDRTFYEIDNNAVPRTVTVASHKGVSGPCTTRNPFAASMVPVSEVGKFKDMFPPPYEVKN